jgi:YihY family inner membrane protein
MSSRPKEAKHSLRLDALHMTWNSIRDMLVDTFVNFQNNGDTNQAAAIALYAILSILPLLILTILMVGRFFGTNPEIQEEIVAKVQSFIPSLSASLLAQLGQIQQKERVLGWVGIISLIWFSSAIFNSIETALNVIFRVRIPRNYFVSKLMAIGMIPLGWFVGIASIMITSIATIVANQPLLIKSFLPHYALIQSTFFQYVIPYFITVAFSVLVYRLVPALKVRLLPIVVGSMIFAALLEIAKHFFTWYVSHYTRYHVIFGSLEAVVILVIWVFYVALIFLICAELIASYQRRNLILLEKAFMQTHKDDRDLDQRLLLKFGSYYPAGSIIFREGDPGNDMYYILEGRVALTKTAGHIKKVLAEMGRGDFFGEMAALFDAPRPATAQATESSDIAIIDRETFHALIRESEKVSFFMLKQFSLRIKHSNEILEDLTQVWIQLLAVLYFLKSWPGDEQTDHVANLTNLSGKDASEIESLLSEFGRKGIIKVHEGRVSEFNRDKAWAVLERRVLY